MILIERIERQDYKKTGSHLRGTEDSSYFFFKVEVLDIWLTYQNFH